MAGGIAHEINNLLVIIKAKADRLFRKFSAKKMDNDNTVELYLDQSAKHTVFILKYY
mgnify:FL=1